MPDRTIINLRPEQFTEAETVLATAGGLTASVFRYGSGVPGLRLANRVGRISLLPFQGQQVWDAEFYGRQLAMRSMFEEPVATTDYLGNYGAFLIHCGATAMGGPGPTDKHPLHGELPNAPYRQAQLLIGSDRHGAYMGLTGLYRHRVAFSHHYVAEPTVWLHADSSRLRAELVVRNLKHSPMELMYLAHINFRPVDRARLVDSVPPEARHMRVRTTLPPQFTPSDAYRALLAAVRADPAIHKVMDPARTIDPELVFALDCLADREGWAHSLQLHPGGAADFVSHRPDQLSHGLRWIVRNLDQDALGLLLPATAEADGYTAEKAKGNLRLLPPQGEFRCSYEFGTLEPDEAEQMLRRIDEVMQLR
jgi:hypothetical protein